MIEAVKSEYGFYFSFTLYDADGSVHTIAGDEAVTMRVLQSGSSSGIEVGTGSIYDAANGIVHVSISSTDAANLDDGEYLVQLVLTTASSKLITKPVKMRILEAI